MVNDTIHNSDSEFLTIEEIIHRKFINAATEQTKILNLDSLNISKLPGAVLLALDSGEIDLSCLKELNLSNNRFEEIPFELANLNLEIIHVHGNLGLKWPRSVIKKATAVPSYLRSLRNGSTTAWHSKVIFIGDGGAGKTSLIRRIVGKEFKWDESPTFQIDIHHVRLDHIDSEASLQLHVWDFGGQEIFDAIHQHFMTPDALVVMVWNIQSDQSGKRVKSWLDKIRSRIPHAHILLVATHAHDLRLGVSVNDLHKALSHDQNIAGETIYLVNNSESPGGGIYEVKKAIANAAVHLPDMGIVIPSSWNECANSIPNKNTESFLTQQKFDTWLRGNGIADSETGSFTDYLNTTGQIISLGDRSSRSKQNVTIDIILGLTRMMENRRHDSNSEPTGLLPVSDRDADQLYVYVYGRTCAKVEP